MPRGYIAMQFARYRSIIGQGSWAVAGQVLTVVFTLGGTRLITQYVNPGLYGTVSLVQSAVLLLRTLFCSPILSAAVRFYPEAEHGRYLIAFKRYLSRYLVRALLAIEVLAAAGALLSAQRLGISRFIVIAVAAYAASDVARTLEVTLLSAARRQRSVAFVSAFETLARPLSIVASVVLFGASVSIVLGAMAASIAITLLAIHLAANRGGESHLPASPLPAAIISEMRQFSLPLIPVAALTWATQLSDRYIIELVTHDAVGVGVYAAGYGLTSAPLMIINGVVQLVLRPVYFAAESRGNHTSADRTFRLWMLATGSFCLLAAGLLFLMRAFVVSTFLGPKYHDAVLVIPWIAFGYVFYALEQVLEQKMLAQKRSHAVLIAQVAGAAVSIVVTIPLVMKCGMIGAAYACPIYFGIQAAVAVSLLGGRTLNGK
jgi:O-antigen/teichoic acid export membrane protein